jgi:hypothetical protein
VAEHFAFWKDVPNLGKILEILLCIDAKGVDGFRYDM